MRRAKVGVRWSVRDSSVIPYLQDVTQRVQMHTVVGNSQARTARKKKGRRIEKKSGRGIRNRPSCDQHWRHAALKLVGFRLHSAADGN